MRDLRKIYSDTYKTVYKNVCRYAKGDLYLAEDAIQHAYERLLCDLQCGEEIQSYTGWLSTVARNYIINCYRKRQREELRDSFAEVDSKGIYSMDPEETYVDFLEKQRAKNLSKEILKAVAHRNKDWYQLVYRVLCQNASVYQVAKDLNMTSDAARAKLRRATEWMRKEYGKQYDSILESSYCYTKLEEADTTQVSASSHMCRNGTKNYIN